MIKENQSLFYFNLTLFIIIIINIIVLSITRESFATADPNPSALIRVETRPCTLHLVNDTELCDKLSDFYKLSDLQLQIIINKMQNNISTSNTSIDLLQFVRNNKSKLPINACKLQINKLKEIQKFYSTSNLNINISKSIFKTMDYDRETMSGYCLADITNYSTFLNSNIYEIVKPSISSNLFYPLTDDNTIMNVADEKNTKYMAIKMKNITNIDSMLNDEHICKINTFSLEDNLRFMRLHCYLSKANDLKINYAELIEYNTEKRSFNIIENTSDDLNDLFTYVYNQKQLAYAPRPINCSIFKFTYDYCKKIEEYTRFDNIMFSLAEIRIAPRIVKHNIDLSAYTVSSNIPNDNIPEIIKKKTNNLLDENIILQNKLQEYTSNQSDAQLRFNNLKTEICPSQINSKKEYDMCVIKQNIVVDEYNMYEMDKFYVNQKLTENRQEYYTFIDTSTKIEKMRVTINDINDVIKSGITVSYNKYADYISNDDYLYLMI